MNMQTTKIHYPISKPSITHLEISYVNDSVSSGWISSLGPYVDRFENEFAKFAGVEHAVSVSNGTVGLHLALMSLGIGTGDEVIVPDLTFVATANSVLMCGAKPVMADISPKTWCMDVCDCESKITSKTKAIIPVHLYGHPAPMDEIRKLAAVHHLYVIEDAAEAHGARILGNTVGGLGDVGVFSFYGNKILTTGEGGMLTTNSREIANRARHLRDHAMSKCTRYWHDEIGYNYRITNMQAAMGLAQLHRIDEILATRHKILSWYKNKLAHISELQINPVDNNCEPVNWLVSIRLRNSNQAHRDKIIKGLAFHGVDSRPFFFPLSSFSYLKSSPLAISNIISTSGLNLPTYHELTESDVNSICDIFISLLKGAEG